ncbi:Proton pump-interactor 3B [Raphanus sativus]|nr:Proton pump-interactor 3B [Raphanus sativus]
MKRKKKLQEKAAAKAAIRAQKEAEKKFKANYIYYVCYLIHWFVSKFFVFFFHECEKNAKKKAAANSSSPPELDQTINELEEVRTLAVSGKEKQRSMFSKHRRLRYKQRGRGTQALPKASLNRRKAHKLWHSSSCFYFFGELRMERVSKKFF